MAESTPDVEDIAADPGFESLLGFLKEQRGFDFTGYKRASLVRRVRRRMSEVGLEDFEDYHDFLETHPDEFTALFNTILINLTDFFRDPDAWSHLLADVLPPLLARRQDEPIRVWCAGCASGEEAYTLAIVLAEALGIDEFRARVKIYATDVDAEALALARQAAFGEREVRGVPDELRERYFERTGNGFVVNKDLRRPVIFGRNDLVQDAPISHIDLLTCRNTLMYFNAETQAKILNRMHFALRDDGVMFLGQAEMLLGHSTLFRPFERRRRFFVKFPVEPRDRRSFTGLKPPEARAAARSLGSGPVMEGALLASAAAQMVLDDEGRLVFHNTGAGRLFGLSSRDVGRPIQDLELSYRPVDLRTHIDQATSERRTVAVRDVSWLRNVSETVHLDLQFVPLFDDSETALGVTVVFTDVTRYRRLRAELEHANQQLEKTYGELRSTNEELETTNEELQSTIEELETTNEELQSTNEELETMNEELQSMNDQLHASNEGLREEQVEGDNLNDFLESVLAGMNAGIPVVDPRHEVIAWNAKAEDLWGVRADEAVGRQLDALDTGLPGDQLTPLLDRHFSDGAAGHQVTRLRSVNRGGRAIDLQVTVTTMSTDGDSPAAAVVTMEVVDEDGGHQ